MVKPTDYVCEHLWTGPTEGKAFFKLEDGRLPFHVDNARGKVGTCEQCSLTLYPEFKAAFAVFQATFPERPLAC